nr:uncharacterized membrane protein At3g27390 [Tanacetum cinerariifolium]
VPILVLQKYESPVLACAISEVLSSLAEDRSTMPSLILPFILDSSKIKLERKSLTNEDIYGIQIGPQIYMMQALYSRHTSTFILVGQSGQHKSATDDLEVICKIGETLASASSLQFVKEKVTWNPKKTSKELEKEPWQSIYVDHWMEETIGKRCSLPRYQENVKTSDGLDKMASIGNDFKNVTENIRAWSIMQCLLASAKSESSGLVISDEVELTRTNLPRDKVFEWFIGPLLVMKEQIKGLQLSGDEEFCLRKLVMKYQNMKPEDWDDSGFPSNDHIRRAQLQAIIRRLQGIVGSMSRMLTFRRKFKKLVKVLYLEALQAGIVATPPEGGGLKRRLSGQVSIEKAGVKHLTVNKEEKLNDAQVPEDWASLSKMRDRLAIHLATCSPFEPSKVSVGLTAPRLAHCQWVLFLLLSEFEQIFIMYVNQKTFDAAYDEQKRHHLTVE